jgi:hypothetical protein
VVAEPYTSTAHHLLFGTSTYCCPEYFGGKELMQFNEDEMAAPGTHLSPDELIPYFSGKPPEELVQRIEQHVNNCSECANKLTHAVCEHFAWLSFSPS